MTSAALALTSATSGLASDSTSRGANRLLESAAMARPMSAVPARSVATVTAAAASQVVGPSSWSPACTPCHTSRAIDASTLYQETLKTSLWWLPRCRTASGMTAPASRATRRGTGARTKSPTTSGTSLSESVQLLRPAGTCTTASSDIAKAAASTRSTTSVGTPTDGSAADDADATATATTGRAIPAPAMARSSARSLPPDRCSAASSSASLMS